MNYAYGVELGLRRRQGFHSDGKAVKNTERLTVEGEPMSSTQPNSRVRAYRSGIWGTCPVQCRFIALV